MHQICKWITTADRAERMLAAAHAAESAAAQVASGSPVLGKMTRRKRMAAVAASKTARPAGAGHKQKQGAAGGARNTGRSAKKLCVGR